MNTMKFAVTHIVGSEETIIKTFQADEKQQAIEFGKKSAKDNTIGVIACIEALFDDNNNRVDNECKVYEVWE